MNDADFANLFKSPPEQLARTGDLQAVAAYLFEEMRKADLRRLLFRGGSSATPATMVPDIGAKVSRTVQQLFNSGTPTAIQWNAEVYDQGDLHSTTVANTRLTAPVAGKYLVIAQIVWNADATGDRQSEIRKNGGAGPIGINNSLASAAGGAINPTHYIVTEIEMTAGDYLEVFGTQNSGGPLGVNGGDSYGSFFMARKVAD